MRSPVNFNRLKLTQLVALLVLLFIGESGVAAPNGLAFLPVNQAFQVSATQVGRKLSLHWMVAKGYYLYQKRIAIATKGSGFSAGSLRFPSTGVVKNDPYFGKVTVFPESFSVTTMLKKHGTGGSGAVVVTYQGCAEAGMCYAPQKYRLSLDEDGVQHGAGANVISAQSASTNSAAGLSHLLQSQPLWQLILVFLLLGLGLAFTPCVLPMLPVVSSMVGSQKGTRLWSGIGLASAYVLGMSFTYSAVGIVTGLFGASFNIQARLQSPWALGATATLFFLLALACFDVFHLQLPGALRDGLTRSAQRLGGGRAASVFAIGSVSALVMSPCVTPPLAAALLYISATQDAIKGGVVLFFLALGMGLPLMVIAVAGRSILPRSGPWLRVVKGFYGVLLLGVALWLTARLLPPALNLLLLGLVSAFCAIVIGALGPSTTLWMRVRKGSGLLLFIYGIALVVGAIGGSTSPLFPLRTAFASTIEPQHSDTGKSPALFERYTRPAQVEKAMLESSQKGVPVVLDIYAKWCVSCQEMERTVFDKTAVRQALQHYRRIQLDVTDNTTEQQHMLGRFGIYGPPTVLFFDRDGKEQQNDRVIGAIGLNAFLNHVHVSYRGTLDSK